MKDSKTTNPELIQLISQLKKQSREQEANIWHDVAEYLSKSRSLSTTVNLSQISRNTKRGDTIIVPGKILGTGTLNHSITIAAFNVSEKAKVKMGAAKAKYLSIQELCEKNPKGSNVKIMR
jgi:large subunit ribosomal protein L18e